MIGAIGVFFLAIATGFCFLAVVIYFLKRKKKG